VFASRTVGAPSRHAGRPWRLPSSPAQSGVAADQAIVGDLVVRAASVVGIGHRLAQPAMPRQDSYRLTTDSTGDHLVIAVSDGVSAAPLSELGATIACRAAVDAIRPVLDATRTVSELDPQRVFGDAARYMAGVADQRRVSQSTMAAVLVALVVPARADRWGHRQAWCAWLGDAGVWLRDGVGWRRLAGDEKAGLDRNQVGAALPRDHREVRCSVVPLPPGAVVSVATDGVGDAFGRGRSAAWFADRWVRPPELTSFLLDVDFDAKQATDDRTAVTVWCGTAANP
jgi:hypothetical protein